LEAGEFEFRHAWRLVMSAERQKRHFGVLSFTGTGHLNPLIALAQQLKDRGHKVTFFEKPKIENRVLQAGLEFFPVGRNRPSSKRRPEVNDPSIWSELSKLRSNLKRIISDVEMFLREIHPALVQTGVEVLIINEIALTGPTLAQMLSLPYFIISTSVPHNFGWKVYSRFSRTSDLTSWFSLEDALLEISALRMRGPIRHALDRYRRQAGFGPVREISKVFPALAQITQLPQFLDFPRRTLPANFYYTGPFVNGAARPTIEFPWDRLDGRPVIYTSFGTTRNIKPDVFHLVAEACLKFDLQLVISLGGRFDPEMFPDLKGNPLVVRYAPQLEILKIARIVITHGGPNTVFEALMEGKPMIAIPMAHDQPAVAARLARLKLAEVLPVKSLSAKQLCLALEKLLNGSSYHDAAMEAQLKIRSSRGLERAVEVIEEALERYGASQRKELKRCVRVEDAKRCDSTENVVPLLNTIAVRSNSRITTE
jgi:zeaxanthin glucosyltransferase